MTYGALEQEENHPSPVPIVTHKNKLPMFVSATFYFDLLFIYLSMEDFFLIILLILAFCLFVVILQFISYGKEGVKILPSLIRHPFKRYP